MHFKEVCLSPPRPLASPIRGSSMAKEARGAISHPPFWGRGHTTQTLGTYVSSSRAGNVANSTPCPTSSECLAKRKKAALLLLALSLRSLKRILPTKESQRDPAAGGGRPGCSGEPLPLGEGAQNLPGAGRPEKPGLWRRRDLPD